MKPHVIRLNRAWEYGPAGSEESEPLGRIDLPCPDAVASSPDDAPLRLTRHFNGPPNLAAAQRVLLVFQPVELAQQAALNDTPLADPIADEDCVCFDVAELLVRHNYLRVVVNRDLLRTAQVRLVIEERDRGKSDEQRL